MTVQELKSYRMNRREIERLTREIEGGQMRGKVLSGAEFPCAPTARGGSAKDRGRAQKTGRRDALRLECSRVEQFVNGIGDPITRRLFELRYLTEEELTWRDVALRIGGNTEGSVKMRWRRYLREKAVTNVTKTQAKL